MASPGVFFAYATALGRTSYGESDKRNSVYTGKLLGVLRERAFWNKNITEVFNETALRVASITDHYQEPWVSGTGIRFCFGKCGQSNPTPTPTPSKSNLSVSKLLRTCKIHFKAYRLTTGRGGTALDCYSDVLKIEPNNAEALAGLDSIEAKYVEWIKRDLRNGRKNRALLYMASLGKVNPESPKLAEFQDQMQVTPPVYVPPPVTQPIRQSVSRAAGEVFRDRLKNGKLGPKMVVIPAGKFKMGDIQGGGDSDEKPVHKVSVDRFAMGVYEVTFAEYDKFAKATGREKPSDSGWGRGNRPVINVSWNDATAYAKWLSQQTGEKYRLPTEAEWEYAARAGTETKYWWGNTASHEYANYGDSGYDGLAKGKDRWKYTAPVGSFAPNPFGIYDTAGNVWEWTCSEYENRYNGKETTCKNHAVNENSGGNTGLFVLRGGSWYDDDWRSRTADRFRWQPSERFRFVGFRLARTP
jgi:formylglycine-generating enzyme required for sulfatase activity